MIAAETLFPVSAVSKLRALVYDILPPTLKTLESDGGSVRGTPQSDGGSVCGTPQSDGGSVRGTPQSDGGSVSGTPQSDGGSVRGTPQSDGGSVRGTPQSDGGSVRGTPQGDGGSVRGTVTAVFHRETPAQKCMLTEPAVVNGVGRGSSSADSASSPTRSSRRFQSQVRQGSFAPESAFSADSLTVFAQPLRVVT